MSATDETSTSCQVVVADSPERSPRRKEAADSPNHYSQHSDPPLRSSLTVTLSPAASRTPPAHDEHRRPSVTSPAGGEKLADVAERAALLGDVTRRVVVVELDRGGVAGLGFCIEGGKQSLTGDRPVAVKRIFRCTCRPYLM